MNETPAVIVNIQRQPGANTISVVKSITQIDAAAEGERYRQESMSPR